jgi:hypothetical protein
LSDPALDLARGFKAKGNGVALPVRDFKRWRAAHRKLAGEARRERAIELLTLALRFQRAPDGVGAEAVAQLTVLATDLVQG